MQISKILLTLGIWTIILPYLGFPTFIKNLLFVATGLALVYLSFILRKSFKKTNPIKKMFDNFSENLHSVDKK